MKPQRLNLALVACACILFAAVHLGIKEFSLNYQAWDMWSNYGHDVLGALVAGHPHGLRYVVYFPAFAIADLTGLPPDLVFSDICIIALCVMSVFVGRVISNLDPRRTTYRRDFVTVLLFVLAFLMNGRMIIPFLGYLLVIFAGVDWFSRRKWGVVHIVAVTLGILSTSLSSGTLVVAMALAAGIVAVTFLSDRALFVRTPQVTVSIALVLLLFAAPTVIGIKKNLAFFGGGSEAIVQMLGHGAGGDIAESLGEVGGEERHPSPTITVKPPAQPVSNAQLKPQVRPPVHVSQRAVSLTEYARRILQYWWVLVVIVGIVAWVRGWRPVQMVKSASPQKNMLYLAITLAAVGGLFGYSVLTLCIVPLLILGSGKAVIQPSRPAG